MAIIYNMKGIDITKTLEDLPEVSIPLEEVPYTEVEKALLALTTNNDIPVEDLMVPLEYIIKTAYPATWDMFQRRIMASEYARKEISE